MQWHVSRHGKVRGPFTESEMFELIGKRHIGPGDMVDAGQAGNWWPIERVPTFAVSFPSSHHPAPAQATATATSPTRKALNGLLMLVGSLVAGVLVLKI